LVKLLEKTTANVVVLAGCASSVSVPNKLTNDLVVITTASGRDGKTHPGPGRGRSPRFCSR
jgi:hypothetical protein